MNKVLSTLFSIVLFATAQLGMASGWQYAAQPDLQPATVMGKMVKQGSKLAENAVAFALNHKAEVGGLSLAGLSGIWATYTVYEMLKAKKFATVRGAQLAFGLGGVAAGLAVSVYSFVMQ